MEVSQIIKLIEEGNYSNEKGLLIDSDEFKHLVTANQAMKAIVNLMECVEAITDIAKPTKSKWQQRLEDLQEEHKKRSGQ